MIVSPVFLAWLLLAVQGAPISQAPWTHDLSASFRSLFTASRSLLTQEGYADDLDRVRVAGGRGYGLSYEIVVDSETHLGNRIGNSMRAAPDPLSRFQLRVSGKAVLRGFDGNGSRNA